jgi:uncharacterized membrane protein YraQ (UPF0718 family)
MQTWLGAVVTLAAVLIPLWPRMRGASCSGGALPAVTPEATRRVMLLLVVASAVLAAPTLVPVLRQGVFAFCSSCPVVGSGTAPSSTGGYAVVFFQAVFYYAATVLPMFVLACSLSGLVIRFSDRLRPAGVLGSFGLAAILPVCSCGVVPLAKTMIDRGGTQARDGLVFLAAAPLLSPVVILLGAAAVGPLYVAARVIASLLMALVVAAVVRPLLPGNAGIGSPDASNRERPGDAPVSALLSGWHMLTGLLRYVLLGVVLGSLVATVLPAGLVESALNAGPLSMAATVLAGVPLNMCSGEEILVTAPLIPAGLTMGHAVAFALSGTGICVSSLPILAAVLGRRGTMAIVALYLVVPFVLGVALSALPAP